MTGPDPILDAWWFRPTREWRERDARGLVAVAFPLTAPDGTPWATSEDFGYEPDAAWRGALPLWGWQAWGEPCSACGRRFAVLPNRYRARQTFHYVPPAFCSARCVAAHTRVKRRARYYAVEVPQRQARGLFAVTVTCAHCGERFTGRRTTARFCGATCRQAAHRAARRGQE